MALSRALAQQDGAHYPQAAKDLAHDRAVDTPPLQVWLYRHVLQLHGWLGLKAQAARKDVEARDGHHG